MELAAFYAVFCTRQVFRGHLGYFDDFSTSPSYLRAPDALRSGLNSLPLLNLRAIRKKKCRQTSEKGADDFIKIAGRAWMNLAREREIWKEKEATFTQTGSTYQEDN
ncbi:hypothetical protein EVAR_66513_1 [Eumeta japonica]|uniref:Uncharacterized protein n=1 Tax=Eumeta variegata TaxID=151549 RepID=A0A4C1Z9W1_EUMVA|nr:hypothetical protein EVAR_66513_1 [Eumeta japonica]